MSKKFVFELDEEGVKELLKSEEIAEGCYNIASQRARSLGRGYKVRKRYYPERNGAVIHAVSKSAQKQNLKSNTLLKAIG